MRSVLCGVLALAMLSCARDEPVPATVDDEVRERFAAGDVLRYRFEWSIATSGTTGGVLPDEMPVEARVRFAGDVELRVRGKVDAGTLIAIAWTRLDDHAISVGFSGRDALPDATVLLDHEAFAVVGSDGEVRDVWFAPDSPPLFRHVMAGMIAQTDLRLPSTGDRRIAGSAGLAQVDYAWAAPDRITRTLRGYDRLDAFAGDGDVEMQGGAEITLRPDGVPRSLDASEVVWIAADDTETDAFRSETTFTLAFVERDHVEPPAMPVLEDLVHRDLLAPPDDAEATRLLAQRFASDLTPFDVTQAIRSASLGGLRPRRGFMIEATGLLRGWPELAADLEATFHAQHNPRGKSLTLDLLASAGTVEAQRVMCDVLGDEDVRAQPDYPAWMQRFVFLWRPTPGTARFLVDAYAQAEAAGDVRARHGVMMAMGTVARRVAGVDPVIASAMRATLVDELEHATDDDTRVAALGGIGNAGADDELDLVLAHLDHPDIGVRAQAAAALRFVEDTAATDALFAMIDDDEPFVARQVISVLDQHRLAPEESSRLAAFVDAVHPEARAKLTSAIARRRDDASAG